MRQHRETAPESPASDPGELEVAPLPGELDGMEEEILFPTQVSAAFGEPAAEQEYSEFCRNFELAPGVILIQYLEENEVISLRDWLHYSTPEAEPKAFIRLMLALMRENLKIREQPGVTMYLKGRWAYGGGPSQQSSDAISVLAQVLHLPIKYLFHRTPESGGEVIVLRYDP